MRQRHSRFFGDERGNFAVIFALALLPVMALAGAAVDYSRMSSARQQLQAAADAGAVAAAASGQSTEMMERIVADFVSANFDAQPVDVTTKIGGHDITVVASTELRLPVLSAFGIPSAQISATSTLYSATPLGGGRVQLGVQPAGNEEFEASVKKARAQLDRITRRTSRKFGQQIRTRFEAELAAIRKQRQKGGPLRFTR